VADAVRDAGRTVIVGNGVAVGSRAAEVREGGGVHSGGAAPNLEPEASGITNPATMAIVSVMTVRAILVDIRSRNIPRCLRL
jgi:hypothetical protein